MNNLNSAILEAFKASGNLKEANKVYLEFIKANFIIPIEQMSYDQGPKVLFLQDKDNCFLPVFTKMDYLNIWASEISKEIQLLKLSGVDLLKGIGENVTICLDIGSIVYKEFNPSEINRMKSMVLKFFSN